MSIKYLISPRTDGANPFQTFSSIKDSDKNDLAFQLKSLSYSDFLKTGYWFAVSHTAKARAGMRCQVCNQTDGIQVHHRTYATHGYEHDNMNDLTVLCSDCHGLFHGHKEVKQESKVRKERKRRDGTRRIDYVAEPVAVPDGLSFVLTSKMINDCRTNGSFTNATLNALGAPCPLIAGWIHRLTGTVIRRENYIKAIDGRGLYRKPREQVE